MRSLLGLRLYSVGLDDSRADADIVRETGTTGDCLTGDSSAAHCVPRPFALLTSADTVADLVLKAVSSQGYPLREG